MLAFQMQYEKYLIDYETQTRQAVSQSILEYVVYYYLLSNKLEFDTRKMNEQFRATNNDAVYNYGIKYLKSPRIKEKLFV